MDNCGVVYVVFGENAAQAADVSIKSLRVVAPDLPVAIVGDKFGHLLADNQTDLFHAWQSETPYKATNPTMFHFMAGRIKPFLYSLSPFDKTLYVDADTEFQSSPEQGFKLLDHYDFMVAKHSSHNIGMLNPANPGKERLVTIAELGGDGDQPYVNSGVLFWKKSPASETLFSEWSTEWLRFQEWDEQLALMRALYKHPLRFLLLPEAWNGENRKEGSIIFHDFHGTRIARSDAG